jgi:hypothetical protein
MRSRFESVILGWRAGRAVRCIQGRRRLSCGVELYFLIDNGLRNVVGAGLRSSQRQED